MLTNQKIQKVLNEINEITGIDIALCSTDGSLIGGTMQLPEVLESAMDSFSTGDFHLQVAMGYTLIGIEVEGDSEYILVMNTAREEHEVLCQMAASQIKNVAISMADKYDRNNFIQNVLLGNLLSVDLQSKARKLHIEPKPRVAFVIDTGKKNNDFAIEFVKNLSDMKSGDFVTSVDTHSIVLIKDVSNISEDSMQNRLREIAKSLVDNLHMEAMIKVRVGYGNVVTPIHEISDSYQEAKLALEVGRVFYVQKDTISYGKLGIGRLIYQLPMSLCEMFIKEVFGDKVPEILDDEEAMSTINKFFENSLNISETARQLYVHRNTLVYRLERIQKAIGLDIRNFDDAMTFRIAVMVLAHMRDNKE